MATEVGREGNRRERDESEANPTRSVCTVKAQRTSTSREAPVKKARERVLKRKVGQPTGRGK